MCRMCLNCGLSVGTEPEYCPRCGKQQMKVFMDSRDFPEADEKDREWKKFIDLKKKLGA